MFTLRDVLDFSSKKIEITITLFGQIVSVTLTLFVDYVSTLLSLREFYM